MNPSAIRSAADIPGIGAQAAAILLEAANQIEILQADQQLDRKHVVVEFPQRAFAIDIQGNHFRGIVIGVLIGFFLGQFTVLITLLAVLAKLR